MKSIFVAGTDTGVGKTVVTGLLGRHLINRNYRTVTQKWIETGSSGPSRDVGIHLRLMGKKRREYADYISLMSPYIFKFQSSPHLAARMEGRVIDAGRIKNALRNLEKYFDVVIVEGLGGLSVPIDEKKLLVDIVADAGMAVLLVVGNRIGAINHALLSIEALRSRGIRLIGLVFNNTSKNVSGPVLRDNPRMVEAISDAHVLGTLPYARNTDLLGGKFVSIGNKIMERL